jgi:transposase
MLHRSPREFGYDSSLWTLEMAAQAASEAGLTDERVSGETILATLSRVLGVRWMRAKRWITSPQEVGAGEDKRILLVLDQAGWHTSGEVALPEGIHLEFLSTGSPELQPAERLWSLTNEAIANRLFEEISEIEDALVERCIELLDQTETIRNRTNYHWWPQSA